MDVWSREIRYLTAQVTAYRFTVENERRRNMSRLTEKLAAAAAVAPRQSAKIEARADAIIARESDIEHQADEAFLRHEMILYEAEQGLDGLDAALRLMSNNPPLEHSTPLPASPEVDAAASQPSGSASAPSDPQSSGAAVLELKVG